jgi:CRISPR-associated endonuclease Csn1
MQRDEHGKVDYKGDFFARAEVPPDREAPEPCRPTSGAKHLMRLFKNDVIRIRRKGIDTYARIAGYSASDNRLDIQPLFASDSIAEWLAKTEPSFIRPFWIAKKGHNYVSIEPTEPSILTH